MADRPQPHAPMGHHGGNSQMGGGGVVSGVEKSPMLDPHVHHHMSENPHSPVSHPSSVTVATPVHIPGPTSVSTPSLATPISTPISGHPISGSAHTHTPGGHISSSPPPSRRTRFKWLPDYELTVFNSFKDSIKEGLQGESTMRSEAWTRALEAMQREHGIPLLKRQIVSKFDNTKSKYRTWCLLKKDSNFTFEVRSRRLTAPPEVWDRYLQVHPEAACFRTAPLEYEDLLHRIYSSVAFYTPSRPNSSFAIMQVQPQQSPLSASSAVVSTAAAAVAAASASHDHLSSPLQSRSTTSQTLRAVTRNPLSSTAVSYASSILSRPMSDPDNPSSALSSATSLMSPSDGLATVGASGSGPASSIPPIGLYDNTRWVEQAMDIFLSEFPVESPTVQLRALRKFDVITTAIMFCKIGPEVRKKWVQEIQEQVKSGEQSPDGQESAKNSSIENTTMVDTTPGIENIAAAATASMSMSHS